MVLVINERDVNKGIISSPAHIITDQNIIALIMYICCVIKNNNKTTVISEFMKNACEMYILPQQQVNWMDPIYNKYRLIAELYVLLNIQENVDTFISLDLSSDLLRVYTEKENANEITINSHFIDLSNSNIAAICAFKEIESELLKLVDKIKKRGC